MAFWLPGIAQSEGTGGDTKAELILFQTHGDNGPQIIQLTANQLHIVNKNGGYELLAKAPDWGVTLFRRDDKKSYFTSFLGFHSFSAYGPIVNYTGSTSFKKIATERKKDLQLTTYSKSPGNDYVMIENFKVAPQVAEILQIYYRVPLPGIPYRYNMHAKTRAATLIIGKELAPDPLDKIMLRTDKWQILKQTNSNDFVCAKGLKPVKTQSEILLSDQKKVEFDSILEDMGVGKKLGN